VGEHNHSLKSFASLTRDLAAARPLSDALRRLWRSSYKDCALVGVICIGRITWAVAALIAGFVFDERRVQILGFMCGPVGGKIGVRELFWTIDGGPFRGEARGYLRRPRRLDRKSSLKEY
jgi:hypothetical protein